MICSRCRSVGENFMSETHGKNLYEDLFEEFSEDEIFFCVKGLYQKAVDFLQNGNFPKTIYLNEKIYLYCWRDIFEDIAKMRRFHGLKSEDDIKLHAYTAAWWIRRKPFQHKENCEERFLYVNENFAVAILLQASNLYDKQSGNYTVGKEKVLQAVEPLLYHLKYRSVNPQTLELFLTGLNFKN